MNKLSTVLNEYTILPNPQTEHSVGRRASCATSGILSSYMRGDPSFAKLRSLFTGNALKLLSGSKKCEQTFEGFKRILNAPQSSNRAFSR